jgi:tetratricopeptide (TPR) repeat protein
MFIKRALRFPLAISVVVMSVAAGGYLLNETTMQPSLLAPVAQSPEEVEQMPPGEQVKLHQGGFARHFYKGIELMRQGRPKDALEMFELAHRRNPNIPEVHVNIGYVLLETGQWQAAYNAFDEATILRPEQANAYYGMAEALENLGSLQGAIGAMNTYIHLTKNDTPFIRKAEAAIWEWKQAIALSSNSSDTTTQSDNQTTNTE